VFGADLIAGFPTETEDMFANTLASLDECGLDYVHVFPYSAREGTPAARMPQLPRALVKERAQRLRARAAGRLRDMGYHAMPAKPGSGRSLRRARRCVLRMAKRHRGMRDYRREGFRAAADALAA